MTTLSFDMTMEDQAFFERVIERALRLIKQYGVDYTKADLWMDLAACHANGTPLDFQRLWEFPESDFLHDVLGIRRHISRRTGRLLQCFLPRCAKP